MQDLNNKTAFVTGGASGIGLGITNALVDAGARVVIADFREDYIAQALEHFEQLGKRDRVHAIRCDVTDRDNMAAAAIETEKVFGPVHVLVNNAGIGIQGPFNGTTYADWDFGLGVNLGGVINGLQTFLPRMRAHGQGGHVVNTSSLSALVPMPSNFVIYVAAKAAVIAISETIKSDLEADNIGVTVLCPGPVRTNIGQLEKNRPAHFSSGEAYQAAENAGQTQAHFPSALEPDEVGRRVVNAIHNNDLYLITHGEWRPIAEQRNAQILAAMPTELDPALVEMLGGRS